MSLNQKEFSPGELVVPKRGSSGTVMEDLIKNYREPLFYPVEHQDRYSASITFQPYRIRPAGTSDSLAETVKDGLSDGLASATSGVESGSFIDAVLGFFGIDTQKIKQETTTNDSTVSIDNTLTNRTTDIADGIIKLYLPTALTFSDGLNYDTPALAGMGEAANQAASQGDNVLTALGGAVVSGGKSIMDLIVGTSSSGGDLARLATVRGMDKIPGLGASTEGVSIAAGVTVNPNVRTSFKGVAVREFSFTFKFLPKSQEESHMVKEMIKRFRTAAYPETIDVGGLSLGFKFPELFDIKVMYQTPDGKEVRVGHKFQHCFLKGVTTTYNPNTMSFFKDGSPSEVDLTLNFIEEKTLDKKNIKDGY